jgi:hypothetical protein
MTGFAILMLPHALSAQIVFASRTDYPTGDRPLHLITADFNGDGKLDLAVTNFGSGSVSILLGRGDGTFGQKTDYPTGAGKHTVAARDINGDGILDLAVSNSLADRRCGASL